jgi:pimeloyl-ACP methyl ester carboxylesterase
MNTMRLPDRRQVGRDHGGAVVDKRDMPADINPDRRRFLGKAGAAVFGVGAAKLGMISPARSQTMAKRAVALDRVRPETSMSFGPVKQINADVLNIGYVEAGPANGRAVVLMHGFPYDIHSYVEVAPLLAAKGYRVVVPYFRGYGTTTFRSPKTPRNVDQAAFALDILALMDALKIDKAVLAGYDWGSRTGDIIAALWPNRVNALVSVTGYLITNLAAERLPLPPAAESDWWYQYYFTTGRGVLGLKKYRFEFGQFVWHFNSPTWHFSEATYRQTAAAFDNPDFVSIVIGNYQWRLSLAPREPAYAKIEDQLQKVPLIAVPTITIDGEHDPFTPPGNGAAYRDKFTGKYQHRVLPVGHNVPQEAPAAFAQAVVDADHL